MKRPILLSALALSLLLNGVQFYSTLQSTPQADLSIQVAPQPVFVPISAETTPTEKAPFHWREIESCDFASYITNLRQIGCPEPTIRQIVHSELRSSLTSDSPGSADAATIERQTAELLAKMLPSGEASTTTTPVTAAAQATPDATPAPLEVPAAFLVGDAANMPSITPNSLSTTPTDTTLAPETLRRLQDLREDFGESLNSPGAQPDSNNYQLNWQRARFQSDDYFSSLYGGDYFIRVQQGAGNQTPQQPAK